MINWRQWFHFKLERQRLIEAPQLSKDFYGKITNFKTARRCPLNKFDWRVESDKFSGLIWNVWTDYHSVINIKRSAVFWILWKFWNRSPAWLSDVSDLFYRWRRSSNIDLFIGCRAIWSFYNQSKVCIILRLINHTIN